MPTLWATKDLFIKGPHRLNGLTNLKNQRINVIGASGTGKTTLAKALAEKLQCTHFDSDDYFHFPTDPPFKKQRSPEERLSLLMADLNKHSSWVLSGGAGVWKPAPQLDCTLAIFLYLPPDIRMERLKQREAYLYGSRIQAGGDMEIDHQEFLRWTAGYDDSTSEGTNRLSYHLDYIHNIQCEVVKFQKPMKTDAQIEYILGQLKNN